MTKRKVEVFTAGCSICDPALDLVKKVVCSDCEVVVYDLSRDCATSECTAKAKAYGVTRIPAVALNGALLDCCKGGAISESALRQAGLDRV